MDRSIIAAVMDKFREDCIVLPKDGELGLRMGGKIEDISDDQLQVLFYAESKRATFKRATEAP